MVSIMQKSCPACILLSLICFLSASDHVLADIIWDNLTKGPTVTVTEVIDGDTVTVEPPVNGATEVRLVGIQAPKLSLGRKGFEPWPLGEEAKSALTSLVLGETVTLYFGEKNSDRYGRILAHIRSGDGLWVQGRMITAGMARVYSFPDNRAEIAPMLKAEQVARTRGLGIWSHAFYAVRTPDTVAAFINRFEIVSGKIRASANVKGRIYLNFGEDWRQDFTISIGKKARKLFINAGIDLLSLTGESVRVRGWVKNRNGPMITLDHPERLEILD